MKMLIRNQVFMWRFPNVSRLLLWSVTFSVQLLLYIARIFLRIAGRRRHYELARLLQLSRAIH